FLFLPIESLDPLPNIVSAHAYRESQHRFGRRKSTAVDAQVFLSPCLVPQPEYGRLLAGCLRKRSCFQSADECWLSILVRFGKLRSPYRWASAAQKKLQFRLGSCCVQKRYLRTIQEPTLG